ncbi:MAG TPA: metalloprotease TldD [Gammaproteobacteria bacterium]|nr:metalloprotease TldD [Gammaproteobacteria bacterium]
MVNPTTPAAATNLALAQSELLAPGALDERALERLLGRLMARRVDYADLYFQLLREEHWMLEDGIVREGASSVERGVGVRAIAGERSGFAYSDELAFPALAAACDSARAIATRGGSDRTAGWSESAPARLYRPIDPIATLAAGEKVALLEALDREARRADPRITRVTASLGAVHEVILIAGSDGTLAADVRPLVRVNVSVIAEDHGRREQGHAGGGGRFGYAWFREGERALGFAREAARQALVALEAVAAPAGTMPVVLGPGWPGVLVHEAVGHGLEGDFIRKGTSAFTGRTGERVASALCTVVDDGTLAERRGSLAVDDEGTPTRRNVLIENGVLKGFLYDRLNAQLAGVASTGSGRRESYAHRPLPRMTNTYLMPGPHVPEEIIASVDRGLYAVNFGGGQVDITSGKFVFSASEAYLIEKGRVTRPVRGATLAGSGPEVLNQVSMVGNDLALDEGIGVCGKDGQSVPVGVGLPTVKLDRLTVGGTGT